MSGEMLTGQDTPVVANEAQNLAPQVTGNPEAQTDGVDGAKESPAPKTFTQAELDAIVAREKAKAERKAFREATQRVNTQQAAPAPKREAFANDEQFAQADLRHKALQEAQELLKQQQEQERQQKTVLAFYEKAEEAVERIPDLLTTISQPNLPFSSEMVEFFAESDVGAELAYFLAKNPQKAFAIAQMPGLKAGRELNKLEAELASKPKAQPSKAPDPIKPVGTRGAPSSSKLPSDEDDIDTWMRKERERQRGR